MEDKELELRKKIYHRLGLDFGSLKSESGNDWVRTKTEIEQEEKEKLRELETQNEIEETNFETISKSNQEYLDILYSTNNLDQNNKIKISLRNDLNKNELNTLIQTGAKEVLINISRKENLESEIIDKLIPNSVYLVKKELVNNQELNETQKDNLLSDMKTKKTNIYNDLILKLNPNSNIENIQDHSLSNDPEKIKESRSNFYLGK